MINGGKYDEMILSACGLKYHKFKEPKELRMTNFK